MFTIWRNNDELVMNYDSFDKAMKWLIAEASKFDDSKVHWFPRNAMKLVFVEIDEDRYHIE